MGAQGMTSRRGQGLPSVCFDGNEIRPMIAGPAKRSPCPISIGSRAPDGETMSVSAARTLGDIGIEPLRWTRLSAASGRVSVFWPLRQFILDGTGVPALL
ncbi:hypothetical protein LY78DRAFT_650279 [Colletotrichum sublineola]|nr:hypothetical protein LY78DRAFT_650279 [Colletotrichum sublineola]